MTTEQKALPRPPARVGRPGIVEEAQLPDPPALTPLPAVQPGPRPPAPTDASGALAFEAQAAPAPTYATRAATIRMTYHGVPVDLYRADIGIGTIEQLVDQLARREGWAAAGDKSFPTLPDGTPICPRHGVPMRLREKQGDSWWSHNVAGEGEEPCYCRGYPGKTSPGWER